MTETMFITDAKDKVSLKSLTTFGDDTEDTQGVS